MNNRGIGFIQKVLAWELKFFLLMILIHVLPVLYYNVFPTVDGPAHLYNAGIISEMMSDNESPFHNYFSINSLIIPNWSGHLILSFLMLFFSPLMAEKILIISIVAGIPISFRYLFMQLKLKEKYILYLIFPFTYSFLLYFGFYNFVIGIIFFFFASGYWLKCHEKGFGLMHLTILLLLSLGAYLSHLFVFAILIGFVGFIFIYDLFLVSRFKLKIFSLVPFLVFIPGLLMTYYYLNSNPIVGGEAEYLEASELWRSIVNGEPAKGISYGSEGIFTKWIFFLIVTVIVSSIIYRILQRRWGVSSRTIQLGILSGIMLALLFLVPNSTTHSVGLVSSRIALFFFFFIILLLASLRTFLLVKVFVFVIINYVNIALVKIYFYETGKLETKVSGILEAGKHIKSYSSVFPVNDTGDWILLNSSNYLFSAEPMIILENYEAALLHFPVRWRHDNLPKFHFGDSKIEHNRLPNGSRGVKQIDYVLILRNENEKALGAGENKIRGLLDLYYKSVFHTENSAVILYEKK